MTIRVNIQINVCTCLDTRLSVYQFPYAFYFVSLTWYRRACTRLGSREKAKPLIVVSTVRDVRGSDFIEFSNYYRTQSEL